MDVLFYTSNFNHGQLANNGWLQESPEFGTSVVWEQPDCRQSVDREEARGCSLSILGRTSTTRTQAADASGAARHHYPRRHEMEAALWILPGMADNTVAVKLGYGREMVGKVGFKVGHNTYKIKPANRDARDPWCEDQEGSGHLYNRLNPEPLVHGKPHLHCACDGQVLVDKYADKNVEFTTRSTVATTRTSISLRSSAS